MKPIVPIAIVLSSAVVGLALRKQKSGSGPKPKPKPKSKSKPKAKPKPKPKPKPVSARLPFPDHPGSTREQAIFDAISGGDWALDWFTVVSDGEVDGRSARAWIEVSSALVVKGVIVNMTMRSHQMLCDKWDLLIPTSKIADLVHQQCDVHIAPQTNPTAVKQGWNASTRAMVQHSQEVGVAVGPQDEIVLVDNEGKWYVLGKGLWARPDRNDIYGWWPTKEGQKPIQGNLLPSGHYRGSLAHILDFVDYSQTLRFVRPVMVVQNEDGARVRVPTRMVYTSERYASLVSYEGALPGSRHPGVFPPVSA